MKHLIALALCALCSCSTSYYVKVETEGPVRAVFDGNVMAMEAKAAGSAAIIDKADGSVLYHMEAEVGKLIVARLKPKQSQSVDEDEEVPVWAQEMVGLLLAPRE